jgi:chromosome segregation ATPase
MFENLRNAFREAVDNFNKELNRDSVPDVVDGLLRQMHQEVTDAKAQLYTLEEQIKKAIQLSEMEEKEADTCRRREQMARRIGDEETATVAAEYAEKHAKRREIQARKALALREELDLKRSEVEDMMAKLKEAKAKRESLSATSGRAEARNSIGAADDLFSELDRMADKIEGTDHQREAEEDLLAEFGRLDTSRPPRGPSPEEEAEIRLKELKRRMGEG